MVVSCLYGPSAVVLFDLLIARLLVIGDVVVILLNLMIWHSNCWEKRSRTVVVPHCTINQWRISEIDNLCLSNSLLSCVHSWTIIVCSRVVEEIYQITELSMRSVLENIAVRLDGIRETNCLKW
ncbi:hypothetical protein T06_2319 [Trichinella sp. T6]|nr:hypothetical protein T06_2319 [Trichinella sp. T6]